MPAMPWEGADPWDRLDQIIEHAHGNGADIHVRLDVETECCWSCELRYTREPNRRDGPDISLVFFAGGGGDPDGPLSECLDELETVLVVEQIPS